MQLRRGCGTAALAVVMCMAWNERCDALMAVDDQAAEYLIQLFSGSDHVAVRSAIGSYSLSLAGNTALTFHWNNERVVIPAIDAPAGSQEAIDAITTASRPIAGNAYQDFIKVRNEFQGGVKGRGASLDYYVSDESDYLGQQLAASYNRDLDELLNLSIGTSYGWDAIQPLADEDTRPAAAKKTTLHWNAVATRVLSPTTQVRVGLEYNLVDGLQHNPYRNVYAGGSRVPERHPDHRERRDAFVKLNQYLSNRSSLKLNYRFYDDDWGIDSHEVGTKLSQYIARGIFASYQYRWYTQTTADFYRDEYATTNGIDSYLSGDYRTAALSSHLFGAALDLDLAPHAAETPLLGHMEIKLGYERYFNSNNYSANILTTQATYRF